jgi:hypothetical protein
LGVGVDKTWVLAKIKAFTQRYHAFSQIHHRACGQVVMENNIEQSPRLG